MRLLSGGITHGQAVALVLLCVFLIVFIVVNIYLVLFLHRKNKKIADNSTLPADKASDDDGTSTSISED